MTRCRYLRRRERENTQNRERTEIATPDEEMTSPTPVPVRHLPEDDFEQVR